MGAFNRNRCIHCFIVFTALILLATTSRAGDDTARFYGTWKGTATVNGQTVTVISVHDASGYHNVVKMPTGDVPVDGTFTAADGKWSSSNTPYPNNGGTYRFQDNDHVVATNAAGQTITWVRDKAAAAAPPKGPTSVDANTAAKNATGYVPPSGRPGTSVSPPATPPARQSAFSTPPPDDTAAEDAALSPNVKAGFAAYKSGDRVGAWRDFMADAQKGNSDAEAALGAMLFHMTNPPGTGFFKDCEKWLLLSAKQGNKHGMDILANYYYLDARNMAGGINPGVNNARLSPDAQRIDDARFALARQWLEKSAALGDVYAMGNLAILLDAGIGGPRDPNRAAQLETQVQKGVDPTFDVKSQSLTAAWQSGHYADALKTAQASAAKGDASAEALLGRAYYEGVGVPRNYATALTWLNKAAAQNSADALFFLGLMYENARGVTQDLDKALKLFDQAAGLGQGYAKMEAAGMREQGEINRLTARSRGGTVMEDGLSDGMCRAKGGTAVGAQCMIHGENIDPYGYDEYGGNGGGGSEPAYEPEPEPEQ
jgi:TPR repeat protein